MRRQELAVKGEKEYKLGIELLEKKPLGIENILAGLTHIKQAEKENFISADKTNEQMTHVFQSIILGVKAGDLVALRLMALLILRAVKKVL